MSHALTVRHLVQIACEIERAGEAFYDEAVHLVTHPDVKRILTHLRDEEVNHATRFNSLLQNVDSDELLSEGDDKLLFGLERIAPEHVFGSPDVVRQSVKGKSERELLHLALEFEHKAVAYLERLRRLCRPGAREFLAELVEEERQHVRMIEWLLEVRDEKGRATPSKAGK